MQGDKGGTLSRLSRIAYLLEYPTVSGGERSLLELLRVLDRERFEPTCIVPAQGFLAEQLKKLDVPFLFFSAGRGEKKRPREEYCADLAGILSGMSADLVHANSLSMGLYSGRAGELARIPSVAHLRDIIKLNRAKIELLEKNDALIAVSGAVRRWYDELGIVPPLLRVVHNGIDCGGIYLHGSKDAQKQGKLFREEVRIPEDKIVIGAAGQICLRKAPEVFLEAARMVLDSGRRAFFCFAGERFSSKEESAALEEGLHRFADDHGMKETARFPGYIKKMQRFYGGIDILVNASHQEPFGRVILEGMANGLPVVATDVGGTGEMIENGESGMLVAPGDPSALAEAICKLMDDSSLCERLGSAARKRVEERFPPARMKAKVEGIYSSLSP